MNAVPARSGTCPPVLVFSPVPLEKWTCKLAHHLCVDFSFLAFWRLAVHIVVISLFLIRVVPLPIPFTTWVSLSATPLDVCWRGLIGPCGRRRAIRLICEEC